MSKQEQIRIIKYNRRKLPQLRKYPVINKKLTKPLRETLRNILDYAATKTPKYDDRIGDYYIMTTDELTYKARKKKTKASRETTNHHFNMLCLLTLLVKIPQKKTDRDEMVEPNRKFTEGRNDRTPINVFTIPRWTREYLNIAEDEAMRIEAARISTGNIGNITLRAAGLLDKSDEIYPNNYRKALQNASPDFAIIAELIEMCVADKGYCTRSDLINNLCGTLTPYRIDKLRGQFKAALETFYNYGRPTKEMKRRFNLSGDEHIYTARSAEEKENESYERVEDTEGTVNHWQISGQG